jgi:hypothetical protein
VQNNACSNNAVTLTAVDRRLGEYCNSLETRSTASAGILLWKIWSGQKNSNVKLQLLRQIKQ